MEFYSKLEQQGLLEELLGLREMECYTNTNNTNQDLNTTNIESWNILEDFTTFNKSTINPTHNSFFQDFPLPIYDCVSFGEELSPPLTFSSDSPNTILNSQTLPYPTNSHPQHYYNSSSFSILDDKDNDAIFGNGFHDLDIGAPCKVETLPELPAFNVGTNIGYESERKKNKMMKKKLNGQPSKNLMAERRRRKRLNDRLSMLRSAVPKISKMDRTSILGDTIDYMKELIQNINILKEEMSLGENELGLLSIFNNAKPEEILIKNSPKFEVERRNSETRIEICCDGKAGLLLSTVTTLEALGIDIQQCVISCFNDFAMQASCSQDLKQRAVLDSEDIKQALFRSAGYGGRCV